MIETNDLLVFHLLFILIKLQSQMYVCVVRTGPPKTELKIIGIIN